MAFALIMSSIIKVRNVAIIEYPTLQAYCQGNVLQMGHEAEDLVLLLMPVVLRIGIANVMIDKNANVREPDAGWGEAYSLRRKDRPDHHSL